MSSDRSDDRGPDLARGIAADQLGDRKMVAGHVGDDAVLLARLGDEFVAIGARCSHYHGPLAEGLVDGETVRCPWHHACFSLRTGEALQAPAFDPVGCWRTERRDGRVLVREKITPVSTPMPSRVAAAAAPRRIVIVGGGAAGFAAAEMLRRSGYDGHVTMVSDDAAAPVDRPNLSKDYLAGTAEAAWVPLREEGWYAGHQIDLRLGTTASALDLAAREVVLGDGRRLGWDRLLLATGSEPVRLRGPGMDLPHVFALRTLADCDAIISRAREARRAVVLGASFIGLEVAASLRTRGLDVHVVAPEQRPMERVLGPQLGDFVRALHEEHGVVFHLGDKAGAVEARRVRLGSGGTIDDVDLLVAGVGVRPRLSLAEQAGLAIDRGVTVDAMLQTSAPGVYAAGDIARWPDPASGSPIRVEHWVVAERQGQTAARNMLGAEEPYTAVPFFWSQHYDVPINVVGHAEDWDAIEVDGDIAGRDCLVRYKRGGRVVAVASIYRDTENLRAALAMERAY